MGYTLEVRVDFLRTRLDSGSMHVIPGLRLVSALVKDSVFMHSWIVDLWICDFG